MATLEDVRDQLGLRGLRALLSRPEIAELPGLLAEGETILDAVQGWFERSCGLLVATDRRLLFVDEGMVYGRKLEGLVYDRVAGLRCKTGLLLATITIIGQGTSVEIRGVDDERAQEFCRRLSGLLGVGPSTDAAATAAEPAPASARALPTFADVGGMAELKQAADDTVGVMLAYGHESDAYRISWNGILLHGPPGAGKTFFVRALAGEYALRLVEVSAADLVASVRGESAQRVRALFEDAAAQAPCILFFDEFDAVARNRADAVDPESRTTLTELLVQLERSHDHRDVIVMAATNDVDSLDPAAIRPGRFDRRIAVGLPDEEARAAIFDACLRDRPAQGVDSAALARRTEGLTPAAIEQVVDVAALASMQAGVPITHNAIASALAARGGRDRPSVEGWSWDRLVLPDAVKAELKAVQSVVEQPERARALGIDPPTGLLLTGPPGTGKTTIAKVLAAEARCSFFPVSAADVTSKWVGGSEESVKRLFVRAREAAPSIVFVDEIDALGATRGADGGEATYDRQLNQLLQEMDGLAGRRGVFVVGATNRPEKLDPALVRGGRLSRTIEIPLPDEEARLAILRGATASMPAEGVDLAVLAGATRGFSGADLTALCQQAALAALVRTKDVSASPTVGAGDFDTALAALRESRAAVAA
ncbi:MAG TPA: AAA family ATPase [Gaiellaceae bacterium]